MNTTTTTAAREAAKNLNIYRAIADHARRAFETLQILPGEYTPAQVADLLKKSRAQFADTTDRREVVRVEVEAFACSFELGDVFALLARLATAYEIPTRDRATFAREAETAEAVAEFDVPTTAAAVCKAIAKKDTDRPAVTFAYIDTERRALVGTDCAVLTVAALPSLLTREGHRPGYLVARGLLKSGRVTIDTNNNATNGAKVAESPEYLHFPRWSSVFPDTYDTDALTLTGATRRELCKAITNATAHAFEFGELARRVVVYGENYTARLTVAARREVAAPTAEDPQATRFDYRETTVELPAPLTRSFVLTFDGRDFAKLPTFDTVYISPTGRPAVFTSPATVSLLFTLPTPDNFENVPQADTDRPRWARPVDVLAALLPDRLAPVSETPAEAITPAAVSVETIETPQAENVAENVAEVAAPTDTPQADREAVSEAENERETPQAEAVTIETAPALTIDPDTGHLVPLTPAEPLTTAELLALVESERERLAAAADTDTTPQADTVSESETPAEVIATTDTTDEADELAPAPVAAALLLLARADLREACKAIATAKPDKATDRDHRAANEARRLLTREGLTVNEYRVKTADGLTLARFMYSYGKKSRRTLCAPLLKVAAEFATAETLADEWADLLAAAAAEAVESEAETLAPVSETPAETITTTDETPQADTLTPAPAADIESEAAPVLFTTADGETFRRGDRVIMTCLYYSDRAEVVGTLTDKERGGSTAEVTDDEGHKFYGWYAGVKHATAETITAAPADDSQDTPAEVISESEADALPVTFYDPAAGVIVWGLADELPTADGLTAESVTAADLLTIESERESAAPADGHQDTTTTAHDSESRPRALLLTLTRAALRLAAVVAALLLLTFANDRPTPATATTTAADLLAPADHQDTPAEVISESESQDTTTTTPAEVISEPTESEPTARPAADRPAVEKRHHARENKRESRAELMTAAAPADLLTADTLTAAAVVISESESADTTTARPLLTADELAELLALLTGTTTAESEPTAAPADDSQDTPAEVISEPTESEPTAAPADGHQDTPATTGTTTPAAPAAGCPAAVATPCPPAAPVAPVAPIIL